MSDPIIEEANRQVMAEGQFFERTVTEWIETVSEDGSIEREHLERAVGAKLQEAVQRIHDFCGVRNPR